MTNKAEQLRTSIQADKSEQLRTDISGADATQYSPAVMANRALIMYAESNIDSLFDIAPEHIPYISYLRAINQHIPIPCTLLFVESQLSLSRSKDRQGRKEFGQALNKQPVIMPGQPNMLNLSTLAPEQKGGIISKIFHKKKTGIDEQ